MKHLFLLFAIFSSANVLAQMQIPNPLVKPRLDAPAPVKPPESDAGRPAPAMPTPLPNSTGPYNGYGSGSGTNSQIPLSNFEKVSQRFSGFIVSAIVGEKAILRRMLNPNRTTGAISNSPAGNGMNSTINNVPVYSNGMPQQNVQQQQQVMHESLTVINNEPIDYIGDSVVLTARVSEGRVWIYYNDELSASRNKQGNIKRVVFVGQVESSVYSQQPNIVLEKADNSVNKRNDVTIKNRSSSNSGTTTNSGQNGVNP